MRAARPSDSADGTRRPWPPSDLSVLLGDARVHAPCSQQSAPPYFLCRPAGLDAGRGQPRPPLPPRCLWLGRASHSVLGSRTVLHRRAPHATSWKQKMAAWSVRRRRPRPRRPGRRHARGPPDRSGVVNGRVAAFPPFTGTEPCQALVADADWWSSDHTNEPGSRSARLPGAARPAACLAWPSTTHRCRRRHLGRHGARHLHHGSPVRAERYREAGVFPDLQMCQICAPWGTLGMDCPPERQA